MRGSRRRRGRRRKSRRRMGRTNSRVTGSRKSSMRRRNNRRSIESMRRRKRKTVHDCIAKSQHFSLTSKQKALWKLEQNIKAIYCYQNLYLILVHGH